MCLLFLSFIRLDRLLVSLIMHSFSFSKLMSVADAKLRTDLQRLGLDPETCIEYMKSLFANLSSNPDRLNAAREFMLESGINDIQLRTLVPTLTKFVLDYSAAETSVVESAVDDDSALKTQGKKKKTVIRGADLAQFFELKTKKIYQQYSDDEEGKPIIRVLNKPAAIIRPKTEGSEPRPIRIVKPVASSTSVWKTQQPEEMLVTGVVTTETPENDYGGFW